MHLPYIYCRFYDGCIKKLFVSLCVFFIFLPQILSQQGNTFIKSTIHDFNKLDNDEERMIFIKNFYLYDKYTYEQIYKYIDRKGNKKLLAFWLYTKGHVMHPFNYSVTEAVEGLKEIIRISEQNTGFEVERIVAEMSLELNDFANGRLKEQEMYSSYLKKLSSMKAIGFKNFYLYNGDWMLYHMGRTFYSLGDYEKALESLSLSIRYTQSTSEIFYTLTLNLIQAIYANQKDYAKAILYAQLIYNANHVIGANQNPQDWRKIFWQGLSSLDIASYYMELNDIRSANFYAERGYKLYQMNYNYKDPNSISQTIAEFDALQVVVKLKLRQNKVEEAKKYLERSRLLQKYIRFNDQGNYFKLLPFYYNNVNYFEIKNDYLNAYKFLKLVNVMEDSLEKQKDKRKIWQIEMRVDAERYENKIEDAIKVGRQEQWLKNLAVIVLGLVLFVGIIIIYKIKNDNKIIVDQKKMLESSLGDKERLLQEIHHRVKNNLQIISGLFEKQARNMKDEQAKKLMKEGQDRVYSIALIHQNLYQSEDLSTLSIKDFITTLINNIELSYKLESQIIFVDLNIDNSKLDIDTAVPTGLIVNELITNCYKYAFKNRSHGKIEVSFYQKESYYYLNVTDNGVGIPEDVRLFNRQTLGMNLVKGLVRQLDGKMELKSSQEGTCILIYFQIP